MFLAEIRDFDITRLDTGVPELEGDPEEDGAVVSQRRAEKTRRLMQLWSAQGLTSLDTKERAVQEQEMMKAYTTFDEEGLDKALAIAGSMALAKVGSGGERTPPKPTAEELIALQIRRRLGIRKAASLSESRAVKQLLDMKARHRNLLDASQLRKDVFERAKLPDLKRYKFSCGPKIGPCGAFVLRAPHFRR
jgi:hypothetical protein